MSSHHHCNKRTTPCLKKDDDYDDDDQCSKKVLLSQATPSFKLKNSSTGYNNQCVTQAERFVNVVRYSRVLKTTSGNDGNVYTTPRIVFGGKLEGQPGGLNKPLRNR